MMDDFNAAMTSLETGITTAQDTAEDAKEEALKLPYVVGSYTGNGAGSQDIYLGFRPSFVILCKDQFSTQTYYSGNGVLMSGPTVDSGLLFLTDTGFRVKGDDETGGYPQVNNSKYTYDYIAFR